MKKLMTAILSFSLLGAVALPSLAADSEPPAVIAPGPELIAPAPEENSAASGLAIEIDGESIDARACVMVPLRAVAEKLGFTVIWDDGAITVKGSERYAQLTIGKDEYFAAPAQEGVVGASFFSLGCAPYVSNDTTYVPVELFDALLGCTEGAVALEGDTVKISANAQNATQIANPFTDHATLEEASKITGFPLSAPDALAGYPQRAIQTMDEKMIQVIYQNGGSSVIIRKEVGSGDISGDYNPYAQTKTVQVNGSTVTMKGESGLVMVAIWENGNYTYAVMSDTGMNAAAMTALIQSVR